MTVNFQGIRIPIDLFPSLTFIIPPPLGTAGEIWLQYWRDYGVKFGMLGGKCDFWFDFFYFPKELILFFLSLPLNFQASFAAFDAPFITLILLHYLSNMNILG